MDALAIPADGVVREGDGTQTVWVTRDRSHFTQRVIETGLREDGEVQVLDGLRPDELVVTQGAIYLDNMINAAPSD
jgi:cobalt-zinc-cadmium efflux system membrane fusion protein